MIKFFKKFGILISCLVVAITCLFVSVNAYELDDNGNIISSNLIDVNSYFNKNSNIDVSDDQIKFNCSGPVVVQLWTDYSTFISEPLPFTQNGYRTVSFTKDSTINYIRIKANYDNRDIWYNITQFDNDTYSISAVMNDYSSNCYLSELMLNQGSILPYEPYGTWYSEENTNTMINDNLVDYQSSLTYVSLTPYTNAITLWSSDDLSSWTNVTPQNYLSYVISDNYYLLTFNGLNSSKYYKVRFDLSTEQYLDYMYLSTANISGITLNDIRFVPNINYNGNYYYFDNLTLLQAPVSSYGFYFKPDSSVFYCKYKANAVNVNYLNTSESYNKGYQDGIDSMQSTINGLNAQIKDLNDQVLNRVGWKALFFGLADTPFKTVYNMLGFDLFGINLFNAFIGFITVLACIFVLKKLL